ncbi:cytochrome c oxidase accessory protein CcoG [Helicobacter ailurogastricus]|uniref:cytochrome c oxidase accessory protein CcoG n=1 Tax=Helicobacter ailurogastricus TaxID=1578720 RepID=UPI000CF1257F|nr:cytochrome c oxidase accessory protein CcoG [Helicobacter ailurogastricus]
MDLQNSTNGTHKSHYFRQSFRLKRYMVAIAITIFAIGVPFIHMGEGQAFLISFEHRQLHLFGKIYNAQEMYLTPFLVIFLFIFIFFITSMLGRVWCGWGCPQTIFRAIHRDLIETKILGLHAKIANKQRPTPKTPSNRLKKILGLLLFAPVPIVAMAVFLFYFIPPFEFFEHVVHPADNALLIGIWAALSAIVFFDIVVAKEHFCIYLCPYARVQSVLFDDNTLNPIYDSARGGAIYNDNGVKIPSLPQKRDKANECVSCNHCVLVCPTHIDIRKGMQLECINCLECVDACTATMGKLNKPSLIQWSSTNATNTRSKVKLWRTKTIAYVGVLVVVMGALIVGSFKKASMILDITHGGQLYAIHSDFVDNGYIFLFQNTSNSPHAYTFNVDDPHISIVRPKNTLTIAPQGKLKVVVILRMPLKIAKEAYEKHDVTHAKKEILPIVVKAYSVDNPQISVQQESVFIIPSTLGAPKPKVKP